MSASRSLGRAREAGADAGGVAPAGGGAAAEAPGVAGGATVTATATAAASAEPSAAGTTRSFGSGARILSIGIAASGLLTFAYFSIASHVLGPVDAKNIDLLWSVMFVIISVIYRPIEQLLSRTIADRTARGEERHPLHVPITIQLSFAAIFVVCALALHNVILDHALHHSEALYWVLVVGTLAYAASYFARGWLAGHKFFGLYGGLVLMEAVTRVSFALAVAIGLASGETAVALGIAAAPFVSLIVVPSAFLRRSRELARPAAPGSQPPEPPPERGRCRRGARGPRRRGHLGGHADRSRRRSVPARRLELRLLGVGDHALRADAPQRGGDHRGRHGDRPRPGRHRVQHPAHRPRPAAAVSGHPDLAAAPPRRPGGPGGSRGVRAGNPHNHPRHRRLRPLRRARPAGHRTVRDEPPVRPALQLRARRAGR